MDEEALANLVRERANDCCEYCRLPQAFSSTHFQIDHIIAEQHRGSMVASNLALACLADNNHKGPNLAGIDPKTGKRVWLFNPRRQKWSRHFRWRGPVLVGRTPDCGRCIPARGGMRMRFVEQDQGSRVFGRKACAVDTDSRWVRRGMK